MLKAIVVLVLSGLWAVVLVPPAWRSLSRLTRSGDSIGTFSRKMSLLGGRSGSTLDLTGADLATRAPARRPAAAPRASARKRRRDVLVGLLAANGFTILLAVVAGGVFWMLWLVSATLLGGYVTLLVQLRKAAVEREMKVAFFPQQAPAPELATVRPLRRVGS
ncbi:MAG TPA: hypothetical protein VK866_00100 [Acidimicrobiales bacterium]|nr:hypothetical protein [Acidimicrobiales bacterium]